ncbi:dUTP diphosphatase [Leuconostoc litchii]|uniref:dUTP diphosphatase n=1 Tax=Leuconostoc litchii TaxID=1981069 RepID=A0A6P2CJV1_9LACO|nr:deoxyuridine 5'-triphosphate nucleotidohydrolase [Leuconostoc litchii]TYC46130.1 deoxyuridine 5'-triphosphate nucleotidohydrolase [Leuconostoc litchii]GMA69779.1 dUTP diphosphatase [Leuconostoc litchii]
MTRGFEIVSKYANENINIPQRSTQQAAGYDFEASADITLPSILSNPFFKGLNVFSLGKLSGIKDNEDLQNILKPVLVPTGIKAYMGEGEYLQLVSRSSGPIKKRIMMPNAVGIVDADYYNNEGNEGEIFFQFINFGLKDVHIKKGERIGQGLFLPYLLADGDESVEKSDRKGGFGSTGQ